MNYYFIDYENVHLDGLEGYEKLGAEDTICVMYTEQSKSITLDIVDALSRQNTRLESFKVSTGKKNSLDFQLSTYLGYIIAKNDGKKVKYYIVSKDTGYDNVAEFWTKRGLSVKRVINLVGMISDNRKPKSETKKKTRHNSSENNILKTESFEANQYNAENTVTSTIQEIENKLVVTENHNQTAQDDSRMLSDDSQMMSDNSQTVKDDSQTIHENKQTPSANGKTENINAKKEQGKKKSIPEKQTTKEEMLEYLDESEYSDGILNIFNSYKTKQAICNGMNKFLKDSKKSGTIYKKLKPLMKKKNRS